MALQAWIDIVVFFNDTATTEIYTLSLHDALPISAGHGPKKKHFAASLSKPTVAGLALALLLGDGKLTLGTRVADLVRSEEHTSELQSRQYLVCRLLLEKKKAVSRSIPARALLCRW